jgi:putative DNA methylase
MVATPFFVWLKRALPGNPLLRDPFDPANSLTPKTREAVQDETKYDEGRPKDRAWFEETVAKAFAEGRRVLREDGVGSARGAGAPSPSRRRSGSGECP